MFIFFCFCGLSGAVDPRSIRNPESSLQSEVLPQARRLVAVAGFDNKSTYAADRLWDTAGQLLVTRLIKKGIFKVVEWQRMKDLFERDVLSTTTLVERPDQRTKANKILLCDLFIGGSVTFFDVRQSAKVSAISKVKNIETTVRVDLWLQDAQTGEYLSAAAGQGQASQEFKGGFFGGQVGSWDPASADQALESAIEEALDRLIAKYDQKR